MSPYPTNWKGQSISRFLQFVIIHLVNHRMAYNNLNLFVIVQMVLLSFHWIEIQLNIMKQLVLVLLLTVIVSCKNDEKDIKIVFNKFKKVQK